ncbi:MAG TPA: hypothetical protein VMH86_06285 [Rhizomicrobium sp.]|nr:hypothetical protein [Rhizomicrobium sp.]
MQGDEGAKRKPLGLAEYLFAELRQAFQDVRQKALEEGWFGRVVTAAPVVEMDRAQIEGLKPDDAGHRPSFEERWAPRERGEPAREHERSHELDIDR